MRERGARATFEMHGGPCAGSFTTAQFRQDEQLQQRKDGDIQQDQFSFVVPVSRVLL